MGQITVADFEKKVLDKEEIVLIVRAPRNAFVGDYDYDRAAKSSFSITEWIEHRVRNLVGDHQIVIVDGSYSQPHGRTKLETLRNSYRA